MTDPQKRWKTLFFFCFGLALSATFCMKWMEADFWLNGERFTILGLELFYSREKLVTILTGLDPLTRTILGYHLSFDFAFMAGIFPGILSLCMLAREKMRSDLWKKILLVLAWLQLLAWAGDITENLYLLKWVDKPVIGDEIAFFHFVVTAKWLMAIAGAVIAIPILVKEKISRRQKSHF